MNTKKILSNHFTVWILVFMMLGLMACTLTSLTNKNINNPAPIVVVSTNTEVPTHIPSPTNIPPTQEPVELNIPVLTTRKISEEVETPKYIIKISYPFIENGGTQGETFNLAMQSVIDQQINEFILSAENEEEWRLANMPETASGLYISHNITSASHNLISVRFDISSYIAGAAHPYPYTFVYNFDLAAGRQLSLEDLFQPGSDYLQKISGYSIAQLENNEFAFPDFEQGAGPTAENYRNWNIQENGILITFDVYQVASYAAGPQIIEIPYEELKGIIGDQSPINAFILNGEY